MSGRKTKQQNTTQRHSTAYNKNIYTQQRQPNGYTQQQQRQPNGYTQQQRQPNGYTQQHQPNGYTQQQQRQPNGYTKQQRQPNGYTQQQQRQPNGYTQQQYQQNGYTQQQRQPNGYTKQQRQSNGYTQQQQRQPNGYTRQQYQQNGYTQQQQYRQNGYNNQQRYRQQNNQSYVRKQKPKKPKLTAEQKEMLRLQKEMLRQRAAFERKIRFENFRRKAIIAALVAARAFIVSFAMAVLMLAFILGGILVDAHYVKREEENTYTFYIGESEFVYSEQNISESLLYPSDDGIPYINMSWLTDYLSLITAGDYEELKYLLIDDSSQEFVFTYGSNIALVNGELAGMEADVLKIDGEMYVPMSFFSLYCNGITYRIDDEEHVVVFTAALTDESQAELDRYRALEEDDDDTNDIDLSTLSIEYIPFSLRIHPQDTTASISEYSLDADILAATDPDYLASLAAAAEEAAAEAASAEAASAEAASAAENQIAESSEIQ